MKDLKSIRSHESLFHLKEFAKASHQVYAYAFVGYEGDQNYGHDEDGEFGVSRDIVQRLNSKGIVTSYVCIARLYGGKKHA